MSYDDWLAAAPEGVEAECPDCGADAFLGDECPECGRELPTSAELAEDAAIDRAEARLDEEF